MAQSSLPVKGYPLLAWRMCLFPENAIFSGFGDLASLDLLYRQAELTVLREKLRELQHRDHNDPDKEKRGYKFAADWEEFLRSAEGQNGEKNGEQLELMKIISAKLESYYNFLIQAHSVATMPRPDRADLRDMQQFLDSRRMDQYLMGIDRNTWGSTESPDDYAPDLVALRPRHNDDPIFTWLRGNAVGPFFRCIGHRFKNVDTVLGCHAYKDSKILYIARLFFMLVASTLLIASISVLNFISSMGARLGAIAAFTVSFSFCLTILNCKGTEIFAITSAFTAVQVVFISTNTVLANNTTSLQ